MNATYQIQWFGLLAERRGLASESIQHTATTTCELYQDLCRRHQLGLLISDLRAAVNDRFVSWDHRLNDGDLVVFLPPMSGG